MKLHCEKHRKSYLCNAQGKFKPPKGFIVWSGGGLVWVLSSNFLSRQTSALAFCAGSKLSSPDATCQDSSKLDMALYNLFLLWILPNLVLLFLLDLDCCPFAVTTCCLLLLFDLLLMLVDVLLVVLSGVCLSPGLLYDAVQAKNQYQMPNQRSLQASQKANYHYYCDS